MITDGATALSVNRAGVGYISLRQRGCGVVLPLFQRSGPYSRFQRFTCPIVAGIGSMSNEYRYHNAKDYSRRTRRNPLHQSYWTSILPSHYSWRAQFTRLKMNVEVAAEEEHSDFEKSNTRVYESSLSNSSVDSVVDFDGPDDPADPLNCSSAYKWSLVTLISCLSLIV